MTFYLIGIDYKTVSYEIREAAHRIQRDIIVYWQYSSTAGRTAVLVTCNRIEIYGIALSRDEAIALTESFKYHFRDYFKDAYVRYGREEIFRHGLRLACGLESQLKGEIQILQQLELWVGSKDFPLLLRELWSPVIKEAKIIRAKSSLDNDTVNVANIVLNELQKNITFNKDTEILVIGTGKVATLIAEKRPEGVHLLFVARKRRSKAKRLADMTNGDALLPEEIPRRLVTVDAVISATSSPHYILFARDFIEALNVRSRPLYIYDLAVPHDVALDVYRIPFVEIQDLDDLARAFSQNRNIARRLELAEELIQEKVHEYRRLVTV